MQKILLVLLSLFLGACTISEHEPGSALSENGYSDTDYGDYDDYYDGYYGAVYSSSSRYSSSIKSSSSTSFQKQKFVDARDGKTYEYVQIGSVYWMAENLNYASDDSYCYNDNSSNCSTYGRMYSFESAQKACPSGWHLPSYNEWAALNNYIIAVGKNVNASLRARSWNGSDDFGFSALPGGYCYFPTYMDKGSLTRFWTSTQESMLYGYAFSITNSGTSLPTQYHDFRSYVRCLRD